MSGVPTALPELPSAAREHGERLAALVRSRIERAGGAIGFDEYMELALYAPGLGYYSAGARKLGAGGDFVTAPEISAAFAHCLAKTVAGTLARGDALLEVGAGSGALAADLLAALAARGTLPGEYLILERSADLRDRQREHIERAAPERSSLVRWIDDLPQPGLHGVVVANEVLDAIPARRFRRTGDGVEEGRVECRGGGFGWCWEAPPDGALADAVAAIEHDLGRRLPAGYVSEVAPARDAFVTTLGERLGEGALILVDYGYPRHEYYHPERADGTLACHYRHRAHDDPFHAPGLQDLSVHVDFSAIATAGEAAGLTLDGYTTQAEFLLAGGLLEILEGVEPGTPDYYRLTREIKLLTFPGQMGDLVKVIAFTRDRALEAFGGRDLRDRL